MKNHQKEMTQTSRTKTKVSKINFRFLDNVYVKIILIGMIFSIYTTSYLIENEIGIGKSESIIESLGNNYLVTMLLIMVVYLILYAFGNVMYALKKRFSNKNSKNKIDKQVAP